MIYVISRRNALLSQHLRNRPEIFAVNGIG
jgi:hypothetical protein